MLALPLTPSLGAEAVPRASGINYTSPLADNLIGLWLPDNLSQIRDLSGGGHHSESVNGPELGGGPFGMRQHNYVRANKDNVNLGTTFPNLTDLSVFAWVTPANHSFTWKAAVARAQAGGGQIDWWLGQSGSSFAYTYVTAGARVIGPTTGPFSAEIGRPALIGFTRSVADGIRLYVNGFEVSSKVYNRESTTGQFSFGQWGGFTTTHHWEGAISAVYMYDGAVSPAFAARLFAPESRWDVFRPDEPDRLFFPDAGGGGATDVQATAGAITWTANAANVNAARQVAASVSAMTWAPLNPTVNAKTQVQATAHAVTWTGLPATIQALAGNVQATAGTYEWDGHAATVNAKRQVAATTHPITYTALPATVNAKRQVQAALAATTWTGLPATISANRAISAGVRPYSWTGLPATVVAPTGVQATTGAIQWTGLPATIRVVQRTDATTGAIQWTGLKTQALRDARAGRIQWTGLRARIEPSDEEGGFGVTGPTARHPTLPTRPPR